MALDLFGDDLLVNEIGNYTGTKPVRLAQQ
jgi:hypothetical protein